MAAPSPACFLAKRSLFKVPIWGWSMWVSGFVPVDRDDRSRATETFAAALKAIERGSSLVIFPEETRSVDGKLKPFKRGGFLMALRTGRPIVPVGVRGSLQIRGKGSLEVRPGEIEISFGKPIPAGDFGVRRRAELVAHVEAEVRRLAGLEGSERVGCADARGAKADE